MDGTRSESGQVMIVGSPRAVLAHWVDTERHALAILRAGYRTATEKGWERQSAKLKRELAQREAILAEREAELNG